MNLISLLFFVNLSSQLTTYSRQQVSLMFQQKTTNHITERMIKSILKLSYTHFENSSIQDDIFFLRNGITAKVPSIMTNIMTIVKNCVSLTSMLSLVIRWNLLLGILTILSSIPLAVAQVYFGKRQFLLSKSLASVTREQYYYTLLLTTAEFLKEIIGFMAGPLLTERRRRAFLHNYKATVSLSTKSNVTSMAASLAVSGMFLYD